jgi:hypothetical protein
MDMKNVYELYKAAKSHIVNTDYLGEHLTVGQEDFGSFIVKIGGYFLKKMESLKEVFGFSGKDTTKEVSKLSGRYTNELKKYDKTVEVISNKGGDAYHAVGQILIPYLPGVKPDYYTLLTTLKDKVLYVNSIVLPYLEKVDSYTAKIVGDEDFRITVDNNKDFIKEGKDIVKTLGGYLEDIMDGKLMDDHRELRDVIPNLSSISTCHTILKDIVGARDLNNVSKLFDLSESIGNRVLTITNRDSKTLAFNKVKFKDTLTILGDSAQIVTDCSAVIRLLDSCLRIHTTLLIKLEGLASKK